MELFNTTRFGLLPVVPDLVMRADPPLEGLEHTKRWMFVQTMEGFWQFGMEQVWLQSLDDPGLALVVCTPSLMPEGEDWGDDARREYCRIRETPWNSLTVLAVVNIHQGRTVAVTAGPLIHDKTRGTLTQVYLKGVQLRTPVNYVFAMEDMVVVDVRTFTGLNPMIADRRR